MTPWPVLRIADWHETYATLQLYAQIVGKIRLALTPKMNEWWNVTFYLTARGLTTSPMPYADRSLSIDFDFIDHQVVIADSDGQVRKLPLAPVPVCDFHGALFRELAAIDVKVHIDDKPQECPVVTPLSQDREHASYDPAAARRFWETLRRIEPIFQRFRASFRGKCSPEHFFWGTCDLAVSTAQRQPARTATPWQDRPRRLRRGGHLARLLAWRCLEP